MDAIYLSHYCCICKNKHLEEVVASGHHNWSVIDLDQKRLRSNLSLPWQLWKSRPSLWTDCAELKVKWVEHICNSSSRLILSVWDRKECCLEHLHSYRCPHLHFSISENHSSHGDHGASRARGSEEGGGKKIKTHLQMPGTLRVCFLALSVSLFIIILIKKKKPFLLAYSAFQVQKKSRVDPYCCLNEQFLHVCHTHIVFLTVSHLALVNTTDTKLSLALQTQIAFECSPESQHYFILYCSLHGACSFSTFTQKEKRVY